MYTEEKKSTYYLESAPIPKAIKHMAIPMILAMVINTIYNIIDTYFIGLLNNTSMLAAVTLALPFTTILMAIGDIFGTGGGTYISRLLGEKNISELKRVSVVNLYSSFMAGILFIIICIPFVPSILWLLGASGETLEHTKDFILVFLIGSPFVIANFTLGQTVRAEGAAKESMIGMIISVIVNVVLDPIFIFLLDMDVMGAAIATVISNIVSVAYYMYFLNEKSDIQSINIKYFKPSKEIYTNIFKIGISAFLLAFFLIISSLLFNNYAMRYGDYVVAAFGIAQRIIQLSEFIGMGLFIGVVPLIAFAYAAKDYDRLKNVIKTTSVYLIGITVGIGLILFFFREYVISLFSIDSNVIETGENVLIAMLISSLFAACSGLITSIFQALGEGKQSTIMSVARGILLIPILLIANNLFQLSGVIWSLPLCEIIAFIIGIILVTTFFYKTKNEKNRKFNETIKYYEI